MMKLTITMTDNGKSREAIPVRSVPLVTNWFVSADLIATALAGEDCCFRPGLTAHILCAAGAKEIPQADWQLIAEQLLALSASIPVGDSGKYEWRNRSVAELPAAAFLWADEFSDAYRQAFNRSAHLEDFAGEILNANGEVRIPIVVTDQLQRLALEGFPEEFQAEFVQTTNEEESTIGSLEIPHGPKRDAAISAHLNELRASGARDFLAQTAKKFGVSPSAIKEAVNRHKRKSKQKPLLSDQASLASQLNAANKRQKK